MSENKGESIENYAENSDLDIQSNNGVCRNENLFKRINDKNAPGTLRFKRSG